MPIANSQQPLLGKRVVVGRTRAQAGALSAELRVRGAEVIEIPFIAIREPASWEPLDEALRRCGEYDWLILTSANGVNVLLERLAKLDIPVSDLASLKIAAIGPATAKAIESHGLNVEVVPKEYVAEAVVESLKARVEGKRVLLVRAKVARDVIPNELSRAGALVEVREAYETITPPESREQLRAALSSATQRPHVIAFTSSSTARSFVELIGAEFAQSGVLEGVALASIGPVTTATLEELRLPVAIRAKEYTIPGLAAAIVEHYCTSHAAWPQPGAGT